MPRTLRQRTTAALATLAMATGTGRTQRTPAPPAPQGWVTTADGSSLMASLPLTTASSSTTAEPAITVDSDRTM